MGRQHIRVDHPKSPAALDDGGIAERRLEKAFKEEHPELASGIEFHSEWSALVAQSESRAAVVALADTIKNMA